jgi:myo-inositol-1(or 4)-monophosphatase
LTNVTGQSAEPINELLRFAEAAARDAGELVRAGVGGRREEASKGGPGNLVTDIDQASEELLVTALRARFPDHAIVAEEGRGADGSQVTWWVDPLDGTNNYAHGFPQFAVSLAATAGTRILCGVTYDPLRDEMFSASEGAGAWLNGRRLAVSERATLAESIVATGFPYDKASNPDNNLRQFVTVTPLVRGIRRTGSATLDLAYVAAGRLDAYWEHGTRPWDVATGVLLVEEAGGIVTDPAGAAPALDGGRFVASNGRIHGELLAALARAEQVRIMPS